MSEGVRGCSMSKTPTHAEPITRTISSSEVFFVRNESPLDTIVVILGARTGQVPTTRGGMNAATYETEGYRLGNWLKAFASPEFLQGLSASCK